MSAKSCQHCGESFEMAFSLTLDEALRAGAIVRGMDIDEDDVREGEAIAATFRRDAMASGDAKLVEIIRKLPEETWGRLKKIMDNS